MDSFLTKKEISERWKCSESAINQMIAEGKLKPSKKIPGVKFSASQILKLEEAGQEEASLLEQKRLHAEVKRLTAENNELKKILRRIWCPIMEYMKEVKI